MSVKRPRTIDTLVGNLRALMKAADWSQSELARRSGVSQRMISHILRREASCSIETAEALAAPFGLRGWHMLIPDLPEQLRQPGAIGNLISAYGAASNSDRQMFDILIERYATKGQ